MKQKVITAIIMGFIITGLISFTLISINIGYNEKFLFKWLKSWLIAYTIVIPIILVIGPKVASLVSYWLNKNE
ncbi:Protein of unknown function [Flavobacterium resistens]|uniref:DUF2798 domain-containing protein n=1 Tax=Flavobacterium resistens TaxID=443612 RepID=A0A521ASW4_9FLAO|nr:DUF2798 domain-containing protein [Flavobacterium resistens]MRX68603.1 DUF2798 domain-containing protein [Flavobacterium resistens]SMO37958.1 Protein of unknown function [Flavobacterium resistens]